jgi:hypothetical protein
VQRKQCLSYIIVSRNTRASKRKLEEQVGTVSTRNQRNLPQITTPTTKISSRVIPLLFSKLSFQFFVSGKTSHPSPTATMSPHGSDTSRRPRRRVRWKARIRLPTTIEQTKNCIVYSSNIRLATIRITVIYRQCIRLIQVDFFSADVFS